jgi:uncharacterized protein (DUF1330 family)
MPKGYWVARGTVTEPEAHEAYRYAKRAALAKYGARFLARGGVQTVVAGDARPRTIVTEFPSLQAATDCYNLPEYQSAKALRLPVCTA